jgi:nucleotide-binding universal stress UspA family protein
MINIKRILCPLDFSEVSHHGLQYAATLARWYGADVSVVYVHPLTAPSWVVVPAAGAATLDAVRLSPPDRGALEAELQRFAATVRTTDVPVEFLVQEGAIAPQIVQAAQSRNADMMVLGTHGRSGVARLLLGSVTEQLLHVAPCPVLTVPPRTPTGADTAGLFEHILVATDFSDAATAGVAYALSLAQEADSRLTVLHVVEPPPATEEDEWLMRSGESILDRMKRAARTRLAQVVPAAAREWCRVTERLEVGRSYREILRIASEEHAGLVVLGAHGHAVLERMFFGTTAHHVVRRAPCPVLTVRPRSA